MNNTDNLKITSASIGVKSDADVIKFQMLGEKLMEQMLCKDVIIAHINNEAPLPNSVFPEIH